jgi:hypothetical protein
MLQSFGVPEHSVAAVGSQRHPMRAPHVGSSEAVQGAGSPKQLVPVQAQPLCVRHIADVVNVAQGEAVPTQAAAMQPPPMVHAASVRVAQGIAMPPQVPSTAASGADHASMRMVASGVGSGFEGQPAKARRSVTGLS